MDTFLLSQKKATCSMMQDMLTFLHDIDVEDEHLTTVVTIEDVDNWDSFFRQELAGTVKYYKAITRLQNSPPCLYHALEYKDVDALCSSCEFLQSKRARYDEMSLDDKKTLWKYVSNISCMLQKCCGKEIIKVPTRDEIATNIKQRKRKEVSEPVNSFRMMVQSQFDTCGEPMPEHLCNMCDKEWNSLAKEYSAMLTTDRCNNLTLEACCTAKDAQVFATDWRVLPELSALWRSRAISEEGWNSINQTNNLSRVQGTIPTGMMSNIEQYAHKVAGNIMNGSMSLADLDVNAMGNEIMKQVSTSDLDSLANNIGDLMPTLNTMKDQLGAAGLKNVTGFP